MSYISAILRHFPTEVVERLAYMAHIHKASQEFAGCNMTLFFGGKQRRLGIGDGRAHRRRVRGGLRGPSPPPPFGKPVSLI